MLDTSKTEHLQKGMLDYRKLKDMNHESYAEGTVIR